MVTAAVKKSRYPAFSEETISRQRAICDCQRETSTISEAANFPKSRFSNDNWWSSEGRAPLEETSGNSRAMRQQNALVPREPSSMRKLSGSNEKEISMSFPQGPAFSYDSEDITTTSHARYTFPIWEFCMFSLQGWFLINTMAIWSQILSSADRCFETAAFCVDRFSCRSQRSTRLNDPWNTGACCFYQHVSRMQLL
jgi:hypothetical protein